MFENKQKLTFQEDEKAIQINFGSQVIHVKNHLSLTDQGVLMGVYMEEFFSDSQTHVLEAEYKMVLAILDYCTDIEIDESTINVILSNFYVWEKIRKSIENYGEFRALLHRTIEEKKEKIRLNESIATSLKLIYDKFQNFVQDLVDSDITPEKIEQAKELAAVLKDSPIGDAIKIFKDGEKAR